MIGTAVAQTSSTQSQSGDMTGQVQGTQPDQSGMMPPGMMRGNMMGEIPRMGMRGHMMKFMFAIADVDGDGALSFEEVTTIHKRIFDKVDADKDGKVTPEEVQAFMRQ
ncbi:MAG: EF-hand domain-containing protein [Phyllobacterium sp.]|uniref:EF-hand domain-containing protein n=1 Tax=Phyllobacterium sp. TaxID=1871046 RepID=UPI0030EFEB54